MKPILLSLVVASGLCAGACSRPGEVARAAAPLPPVVTDTAPVGDGIKTFAYALLGASVVLTLGRLLR